MRQVYSDAEILDIAKKIRALQHLTKTTGCHTTKAQHELLRPLPLNVLTQVSLLLAEDGGAK